MKTKHLIHALDQNFKTVSVVFKNDNGGIAGKAYTYKVHLTDKVEADDYVVVNVGTLKIAKIIEVHDVPKIDYDSDIDYKWIVSKIDLTGYNERIEREKGALDEIKRAEHKKRAEQAIQFVSEEIGVKAIDEIKNKLIGN